MLALTINGQAVTAPRGASVLAAATAAGVTIPTLCHHHDLDPSGACRLCVVEIDGVRGFPTSCTTPAADGMVVRTHTPQVVSLRRNILKLLLSSHTSPCIVCLHKEPCERLRPAASKASKVTRCATCSNRKGCHLRELCIEHEINDLDLPIAYKNKPIERLDPFMDRDRNLCVLCGRCVRVCRKLHGQAAIEFIGRGEDAHVGTAFQRDHSDTGCQFCGACIDICPTGTLTDRFAKWHGGADATVATACVLCPQGCALNLKLKRGRSVGAEALAFTREDRICAIGRFVLPQMAEVPARLTVHQARYADGLRQVSFADAVGVAAAKLAGRTGAAVALVTHPSTTREELFVLRQFAQQVLHTDQVLLAGRDGAKVALPSSVTAVLAFGDLVAPADWARLEVRIIADLLPSPAAAAADVIFGAVVPSEMTGTFRNAAGTLRTLDGAAQPPPDLHADWQIVSALAQALGASGCAYDSVAAITQALDAAGAVETVGELPSPSPLDEPSAWPQSYRGHDFIEISSALKTIRAKRAKPAAEAAPECVAPVPVAPPPAPAAASPATGAAKRFRVVEKQEIVPNMHSLVVHAPEVAAKCQPGQFVIAMVNEASERIPYTVADWDREQGTVTINVIEAGRSSMEIGFLQVGDHLAHFVGPLGMPIEVKNYGTVVCGGGCYGVGGVYPLARALKAAGNRVLIVEEASSAYLLHWQEKLQAVCDELLIATKDGTHGTKGGVQEVITGLVQRGEKIDQAFIMGCTFMMMLVCDTTKDLHIPTLTALNPIMVDGTGMCGACRVTVGGKVKFACVDGPFLDGHQVDWMGVMQRGASYGKQEIAAMPQDHREHACMKD